MKTFGFVEPLKMYRKRLAVYGVFLSDDEEKIAIVRNEKNHFFLPGGGIEGDETFKQCLKREVVEETGFSMEMIQFIGQAQYYFYSDNDQEYYLNIGHFYLCQFGNQICLPTENNHFLEWVSVLQAKQNLALAHQVWALQQALTI
jgi:8-oxo-dGTP diphosphatase